MVHFKCPSQTCREPDLGLQLNPLPKSQQIHTHTHTPNKIHSHRLRLWLPLENFIYMSIYSKVQVHDAAVKLPVCLYVP